MLKGVLTNPKTRDLKSRLRCSQREVIGILELLWHFAGEHAPQGNIGKHTNGAIADACDWPGEPNDLVNALVAARFLDTDPTHRLLVHDWAEHAQRWVRAALQKRGLTFCPPTTERSTDGSVDASRGALSSSPFFSSPPIGREARNRAHQLPADFELSEEREQYAREQGIASPADTFESFRLHHTAKGSTMKNWNAAWQKWCRNEKTFKRGGTGGKNQQGAYQRILEANGVIEGHARRLK